MEKSKNVCPGWVNESVGETWLLACKYLQTYIAVQLHRNGNATPVDAGVWLDHVISEWSHWCSKSDMASNRYLI